MVIPRSERIRGENPRVGDRNGKEVVLQIVPVVESVQFPGNGTVQLTGKGLIEGHDTLYHLGDAVLIDASVSSAGFDVFANNTRAILALPQSGAGTLTVTTAGGTSAPVAWTPPDPIAPLAAFVEDEAPSAFARMRQQAHRR